ncbi:MAG: hypothetical protein IT317_18985 [Anaerolineales bacterium]|nr:hypothetical protein [Anaerolineales bacterium]
MYYLNHIGYGSDSGPINPSPNPIMAEGYLVYQLQQAVGAENVSHIPIFTGGTWETRIDMFQEMFEINHDWSSRVVDAIEADQHNSPLEPGQPLVLVGNSGGGTVAIEALDQLAKRGIAVDQVVLRGSPVLEKSLSNVRDVDYITAGPSDYYYSQDSNPFDGVQVQEHRVDMWFHTIPNPQAWKQVGQLIASLVVENR